MIIGTFGGALSTTQAELLGALARSLRESSSPMQAQKQLSYLVDDVIAEGVAVPDVDYSVPDDPRTLDYERECWARHQFANLWDSINADRGFPWSSNPWIWVVEFRR